MTHLEDAVGSITVHPGRVPSIASVSSESSLPCNSAIVEVGLVKKDGTAIALTSDDSADSKITVRRGDEGAVTLSVTATLPTHL
jgi:hypothetical protein